MKICNVINDEKMTKEEILEKLETNHIYNKYSLVVDDLSAESLKNGLGLVYKLLNTINTKESDVSIDDEIEKIAIDILTMDIKYLIIFEAEKTLNCKVFQELYKSLEDTEISFILISNEKLFIKNKNFSNKYSYYTSFKNTFLRLRTEIKKELKKDIFTNNETISSLRHRAGILKKYESKNSEISKFYEKILNKRVSVLTTGYKNSGFCELSLGVQESFDNSVIWSYFKTSELKQMICNDNEFTFIISDTESFTIETPQSLMMLDNIIINKLNYKIHYIIAYMYNEYGEDFIKNYKTYDELPQGFIEESIDELCIEYIIKNSQRDIDLINNENDK